MRQYDSASVRERVSTTVRQYDSTIVRQYHSTTVRWPQQATIITGPLLYILVLLFVDYGYCHSTYCFSLTSPLSSMCVLLICWQLVEIEKYPKPILAVVESGELVEGACIISCVASIPLLHHISPDVRIFSKAITNQLYCITSRNITHYTYVRIFQKRLQIKPYCEKLLKSLTK